MASKSPSIVGLIPSRAGSKRLPNKNIRKLNGHPLLAYSIQSALDSGIFEKVVVSTDSEEYAEIAVHYGADVPFLRPAEFAGDTSPDFEWIEFSLNKLVELGNKFDCFSIMRPTSPLRSSNTLRRAWLQFTNDPTVDSLRAVESVKQHPGKMWVVRNDRMHPLLPLSPENRPWHSIQAPELPSVYVQNASLEISWTKTITKTKTIAGSTILPFFTEGYEGFDINIAQDWFYLEHLLGENSAQLPDISTKPW